ncbi:hypothetical protein BC834DRAFT_889034 [Gloeopeniophorella convolvens]|nr:hypothetical protein BC834DRAFT_889034 [Gloeopeniophorella convolvens]
MGMGLVHQVKSATVKILGMTTPPSPKRHRGLDRVARDLELPSPGPPAFGGRTGSSSFLSSDDNELFLLGAPLPTLYTPCQTTSRVPDLPAVLPLYYSAEGPPGSAPPTPRFSACGGVVYAQPSPRAALFLGGGSMLRTRPTTLIL